MSRLKGKARAKVRKKNRTKEANRRRSYRQSFLDKIVKWDDPVLSTKCEEVSPLDDLAELKKVMSRVLSFSDTGVGLAAPQVGVLKKVLAVKEGSSIRFFINAKIVEKSAEVLKSREACLSFPGVITTVDRYESITVEYEDENRESHTTEFKDFISVVLQHEIDHTNGICKVGEEWKKQKGLQTEDENEKSEVESAEGV